MMKMDPLKKPFLFPTTISQSSSIPEILSLLKKKSSFQDKDFSFVQGILMGREKKFRIDLENLKKTFEEERRRIEERYKKIIEERGKDHKEKTQLLFERIDELKKEKIEAEDKIRAYYEEKFIELNGRVSSLEEDMGGNDGVIDFHEVQFSHGVCNSAGNCSGKSRNKEPLPINLASEGGDPLACEAVDCFKNKMNAVSDKPESSPVIVIIDSDDEMACASNRCGLGGNLACCSQIKEVNVQDSSNSTQKRKRSTNDSENSDGSSFGRQITRSYIGDNSTNPERSSKIAPRPEQNSVFIRRREDKVGVKYHSEHPNESDSDNDSCSTKKIDMFVKEVGKWLSEDDLCSAFEKDPELCLNAVCALYRQQISENKSSYSMSQIDEMSITALGKYLIAGDPENKLRRTMSEVRLKDQGRCKRLAIRYCHQLFQIYHSKKDSLFCRGGSIV